MKGTDYCVIDRAAYICSCSPLYLRTASAAAVMGTVDTAEPMQTDPAGMKAAGPSKQKVDRLTDGRDAPWVEKYRPKTLDDVAAHKEIIDTSKQAKLACS